MNSHSMHIDQHAHSPSTGLFFPNQPQHPSSEQAQQKDTSIPASSSPSPNSLNTSSPFLDRPVRNNMAMTGVIAALQSLGTSSKSPTSPDGNQHANSSNDLELGPGDAQGQGLFKEQILLEQFKLAQLKQLQELQQQIFQQQMALINGSHPLENQPRDQRGFHGLPTPGSSTELRPSQPFPVEFISPMQLNYNDMDPSMVMNLDLSQQPHSVSHTPIFPPHDPAGIDIDINGLGGLTSSSAASTHFGSNISFDTNSNSSTGNNARSHEHYFAHRGTASAPAHIAFGNPYQNHNNHQSPNQHALSMTMNGLNPMNMSSEPSSPMHSELDFDISPLTSPWLGAKASGNSNTTGAGNNERIHTYGQNHYMQNGSHSTTHAGKKRPASPGVTGVDVDIAFVGGMGSRKRQASVSHSPATMRPSGSPAIRPTNVHSSSGRPSRASGSRSVNSTPLLRGANPNVNANARNPLSRRGSVTMPSPLAVNNGPTGGFSSPLLSATPSSGGATIKAGVGTPSNSEGTYSTSSSTSFGVVGDSPSPVDLSLSMPPPAAPASASTFNTNGRISSKSAISVPDSLVPVTPASIMNLSGSLVGGGGLSLGSGSGGGALGHARKHPSNSNEMSEVTVPSPFTSGMATSTLSTGTAKTSVKNSSRGTKSDKDSGPSTGAAGSKKSGRKAGSNANTGASDNTGATLKHILPAGGNPSPSAGSISMTVSRTPAAAAASSSSVFSSTSTIVPVKERKTSHKAAEQKRRDSLKTTFDDLRGLLPQIPLPTDDNHNSAGVDDGTGLNFIALAKASMLPGALPPRGPPKAGGEGPNKGVSKLQLLICGNEYIRVLKGRVERRDEEVERLRTEVRRLRTRLRQHGLGEGDEGGGEGEEDDGGGIFGDGGDSMNRIGGLDLDRDLDAVEILESMRVSACGGDELVKGGGMLPGVDEDDEEE
ncbi:hypothetical protein D9757_004227 [Collybiopsis confluens]|uniref:BHLH domain-containing protein n=1 Tax=Collybiopsis confluens TaxID=2823264 RepID=A0A8H5HUN5_9AGAR|nr:hypothetical protein D9757_004227 [Collybiopsis confluens]